jgi:hypothetical protein
VGVYIIHPCHILHRDVLSIVSPSLISTHISLRTPTAPKHSSNLSDQPSTFTPPVAGSPNKNKLTTIQQTPRYEPLPHHRPPAPTIIAGAAFSCAHELDELVVLLNTAIRAIQFAANPSGCCWALIGFSCFSPIDRPIAGMAISNILLHRHPTTGISG